MEWNGNEETPRDGSFFALLIGVDLLSKLYYKAESWPCRMRQTRDIYDGSRVQP